MKTKKLLVQLGGLLCFLVVIEAYSRGAGYGHGTDPVLSFLGAIVGTIISYIFLFFSIEGWAKRKNGDSEEKKKTERVSLFFSVPGYLIVAFFLVAPALFIIKMILYDNYLLVRNIAYILYIPAFILITYLRRSHLK